VTQWLAHGEPPAGGGLVPAVPTGIGEDWYRLYFTSPGGLLSVRRRGGPDAALAQAIDESQYSIDLAVYDLDLWSIRDALIRARRRGVQVRVVTERDNAGRAEIGALIAAGIPVIEDNLPSLMHHKFAVLDSLQVWSGSMNMTLGSAYSANNNLLALTSSELASSYTREFEEMFLQDRFGAVSLADTPYPSVIIQGNQVEVLFSPDDGVQRRLLELVGGAEHSVDFLAFSFTSAELAEAMLDRAGEGVEVRGVFDEEQSGGQGSAYRLMRQAGLDVRLDTTRGDMHHKVILIDDAIVVTGSYNFSRSAEEQNDENVLILHAPPVAAEYLIEFERIFRRAAPSRG
jgi:phosphatidylserine/phosphatidylglycerophosphate/cardiolipin synthase-like enzyme